PTHSPHVTLSTSGSDTASPATSSHLHESTPQEPPGAPVTTAATPPVTWPPAARQTPGSACHGTEFHAVTPERYVRKPRAVCPTSQSPQNLHSQPPPRKTPA